MFFEVLSIYDRERAYKPPLIKITRLNFLVKKNTTTILMKRRGCLFLKKTRYDLRPKLVLVVVLVLENKTSCNLMMLRSVSDRKVPQLVG